MYDFNNILKRCVVSQFITMSIFYRHFAQPYSVGCDFLNELEIVSA